MQLAGYGVVNRAHHLITTRLAPNITPTPTAHNPRLNHRRSARNRIEPTAFEALMEENMKRCDAVWPGRCLPTSRRIFYDATIARLYSLEWYGGELEGIRKETVLA
jgi:hypothetical protein